MKLVQFNQKAQPVRHPDVDARDAAWEVSEAPCRSGVDEDAPNAEVCCRPRAAHAKAEAPCPGSQTTFNNSQVGRRPGKSRDNASGVLGFEPQERRSAWFNLRRAPGTGSASLVLQPDPFGGQFEEQLQSAQMSWKKPE